MTPISDSPINEDTSGLEEARQAVAQARKSNRSTDALIASTTKALKEARAVRESNHFADKFRSIIRGAA